MSRTSYPSSFFNREERDKKKTRVIRGGTGAQPRSRSFSRDHSLHAHAQRSIKSSRRQRTERSLPQSSHLVFFASIFLSLSFLSVKSWCLTKRTNHELLHNLKLLVNRVLCRWPFNTSGPHFSCKKMVQVSHLSMELFYCLFCTDTFRILNKCTALTRERTSKTKQKIND